MTTAAAPESSTTPSQVDQKSLGELIKDQKEWTKALFFDQDRQILATTANPLEGEISAFINLYTSREVAMKCGVVYLNEQYDVHRYHDHLIYGRKGDSSKGEGEGIALCRVERSSDKKTVYGLITYAFPTVSARAVPQLQKFCLDNFS